MATDGSTAAPAAVFLEIASYNTVFGSCNCCRHRHHDSSHHCVAVAAISATAVAAVGAAAAAAVADPLPVASGVVAGVAVIVAAVAVCCSWCNCHRSCFTCD